MSEFSSLFNRIAELVLCHSPSGAEQEIDRTLLEKFTAIGVENWQDEAGNVIARIPGETSDSPLAITAHKDEIGTIVKRIREDGTLEVRRLGGSFPWVYGEGVMDILGDRATLSGILSFGSRHVSHESPQKSQQEDQPLFWENAWVETKCSIEELETAGVRPGTRVVIGKHRKQPFRLNENYIASYTLDNKASLTILLDLAQHIKNPPQDVYLIASAKEEIGAIGALYFTQNQRLGALIALEIIPLAAEYTFQAGVAPVLLSQDKYGLYDDGLNQEIVQAAQGAQVPLQRAIIDGFGSDGSIAMKMGHVSRAACLGFPTDNTHGYEIAHLSAIAHCTEILTYFANHAVIFVADKD
ncbi:MAG: M42 family peptidase [Cyanobacteria bacterium]|jgi:putative aminopeptidase FrvX|nr:M42 family peptidase [Cyanobacteria bacterium GSL.Bin1]